MFIWRVFQGFVFYFQEVLLVIITKQQQYYQQSSENILGTSNFMIFFSYFYNFFWQLLDILKIVLYYDVYRQFGWVIFIEQFGLFKNQQNKLGNDFFGVLEGSGQSFSQICIQIYVLINIDKLKYHQLQKFLK
eukprot:TRINITY_DN21124_c0_g1_i1.p4 TRINITY_DN21124_c0_g1~~TRINITY_DN21124_c0_g1_i1.p4  ORF type:complete len:133 (+),score=9.49 TRINITY_DN21124_c0_g1_i1:1038-1436(+)